MFFRVKARKSLGSGELQGVLAIHFEQEAPLFCCTLNPVSEQGGKKHLCFLLVWLIQYAKCEV